MGWRARHRTPSAMALVAGLLACSVGGVAIGWAVTVIASCWP